MSDISAAIYVRVSTEEQALADKASLSMQREKAEAYCKAHDWRVGEVYEDAGVSGTKADRPALSRLMADAQTGAFQRVVFLKLDRLGRNLRNLLNISHKLDEFDVGIVSVQDSFDTGTPSGRLFFSILGAVAEFERELIVERSMSAKQRYAENGRYFGGPAPYGYDYGKGDENLTVNEPEAAVVRRIYRMYIQDGLSQAAIAEGLNAEGIATKTERVSWRSLDGIKRGWTRTHVKRILTNTQYRGEFRWGKDNVPVSVPAIVSEEEFLAAQKRAVVNKRESQRPRDRASLYLLSGLIRCRECGGAMITTTQHIKRGRKTYLYRYYVCATQHNYGTPCRPSKRVNAVAVENELLGMLAETFSDPDKVLAAVDAEAKDRQEKQAEREGRKAALIRRLTALGGERDSYITMRAQGRITSDKVLDKHLSRVDQEADRLREDLQRIIDMAHQTVVLDEIAGSAREIAEHIGEIIGTMPLEEKKALVRQLVERVWLDGKNILSADCVVSGLLSDSRTVATNASGMARL